MISGSKLPICWRHENVRKAISIKAKTDDKQTHYFHASHSPMSFIQDVKSKRKLSEEDLFKNVTTSSQRDKQVVIYGEPGAGKSHLVHWLKLRFDYGKDNGELGNFVPVLIERRSGSLKDALTQLIEQLGEGFRKYLDPVQQALEKLSSATARQMLVNELSLELGPRWADRGREKIDKRLKHLGQACRAEGFGGWLCRDGGVIDRTIALLVETSDLKARENAPRFKPEDLLVKDRFRTKRTNSEEVLSLIDELDDSRSIRELASQILNEALSSSIRDMLGLSGANLRTIFDSIRFDLNLENKKLALFVEDVSAMSEIDVEIVNALEPQDRIDLCPMTAVLGMTHTGFAKLRDNQRQRIEFIYRVDGETTMSWSKDKENLSRFIARYLNAIRLDEEQVRQIASDRRASNSDVGISKCTGCPAREKCHSIFGSVKLGDTAVGLYPFSRETAPNVLELIRRDETASESPNQRGLLMRLLIPVMSDVSSLEQSTFPNVNALPVRVSDPYYWTEFKQSYLGDYSEGEQNRIQILAGLWIEQTHESADAASLLRDLLAPLGLPDFTKEVKKTKLRPDVGTNPPVVVQPLQDKMKEEIAKLLDSLSSWLREDIFKQESYFRDLLSSLIKNSIRWEDYIQPAQFDTTTWKIVSGRGFIKIAGQAAAAERIYFEFPRTEETRVLLEALFRFEKEGNKSWNFRLGETHKRNVVQWLRKYESSIIASLDAQVDHEKALKTSVQVLSLVAVIRDRSKLPQRSISELVNSILKPKWEKVPQALSKEWIGLLSVIDNRCKQVIDFLQNEIAIRQGRTGGINFIFPNSLIKYANEFNDKLEVSDLGDEYFQSFWKSRYAGLPSRSSPERDRFENLNTAIDMERKAIASVFNSTKTQLDTIGFSGDDVKASVMLLCDQIVDLVETVKKAKVILPDDEFDSLVKTKIFTEKKMFLANTLARVDKVVNSTDPYDILTFGSTDLIECQSVINVVYTRVQKLDAYIMEQEDEIKKDGDPSNFVDNMFESLRKFSSLIEDGSEVENDVDF